MKQSHGTMEGMRQCIEDDINSVPKRRVFSVTTTPFAQQASL